ncbi:hypothetical protein JHJ32_15865 [Parapedobacter sp. ISTM3]|uniref:hypothetical protein n=1 Tax=Parapedobacter sp. ISTM3 TaxID=2800130 RepID=UPI001906A7FC|nr:hypothetical protein [Parapedobacter sp. ISTM3]MBK1441474.1 hypothetical protein [Parapedobacter sp. ISTM3]
MKQYYIRLTPVLLIALVLSSCQKTAMLETEPDTLQLEIAGEGGESTVELGEGDWQITRVVNNNGNLRMFGDIYALDGKIIQRNQLLELAGLGALASSGPYSGFRITHETPGTINVSLQENGLRQPLNFVIVVSNGSETREIVISQPQSAGYSFDSIVYFLNLEDGDGDSIYVRKQIVQYQFNLLEARPVEISPFNGPDVVINSNFLSDDPHAFVWLAGDSVKVPVPSDIVDGEIQLSDHKEVYGAISNQPYGTGAAVTILAPAGQSIYAADVETRRRAVSYKLIMTNNRTGESKQVLGKWLETSPTGIYEIREIR